MYLTMIWMWSQSLSEEGGLEGRRPSKGLCSGRDRPEAALAGAERPRTPAFQRASQKARSGYTIDWLR